jgi:hypothetical protein
MPKGNPAGYFNRGKSSKRTTIAKGRTMGAPKMGAMQTPAELASVKTRGGGGRRMRGRR